MSLPGPVDQRAAGPLCPRAPPEQLSASRRGHGACARGVTPYRCFPLARRCGPHGCTQTCPVFPASPIAPDSPDSQTCVLSRKGRPCCPEQEAAEGTMGRPSSSPKGARKRFLAILGRSSHSLRGSEAAPRRPRFPVTCSGLHRRVSRGAGCIYARGAWRPFYSPRA